MFISHSYKESPVSVFRHREVFRTRFYALWFFCNMMRVRERKRGR